MVADTKERKPFGANNGGVVTFTLTLTSYDKNPTQHIP